MDSPDQQPGGQPDPTQQQQATDPAAAAAANTSTNMHAEQSSEEDTKQPATSTAPAPAMDSMTALAATLAKAPPKPEVGQSTSAGYLAQWCAQTLANSQPTDEALASAIIYSTYGLTSQNLDPPQYIATLAATTQPH